MARKGSDSLSEIFKALGVREEGEGSGRSKEGRGGKKGKSGKMEKKGELERIGRVRAKEIEEEDWEVMKEKMEKMLCWQRLPGMVEEMSRDERVQWNRDLHKLSFLMEKYDFKNQKDKEKLYPVIYSEVATRIILKTFNYQTLLMRNKGETKTKNKPKNKKSTAK